MAEIAFTGDLAFSRYFSNSYTDDKLLSDEIISFLSEADYTVVNVEGAISSGKPSADKALLHANSIECVNWIKKLTATYGILQTITRQTVAKME